MSDKAKSVILITGAGGWLGGLLAGLLLEDQQTPNPHLILADIVAPRSPAKSTPQNTLTLQSDLTDASSVQALFETALGVPDTIYCFHGIMSRGSEENFDLGLRVNVDSIRLMLDAARHATRPEGSNKPIRFVFTSSLAVYGGVLPALVDSSTITTPEGAYGTGKLISELLVNEYSRRGFVDGIILRLPTIVVRPGPPSNATSAFISGIIREPLHGERAICPVGSGFDDPALGLAAWVASPETTLRNFVIAKHVPTEKLLKHTRTVYLPGFTVTVKQELEALEQVAGKKALDLIDFQDDPINRRIVSSWPAAFDNKYPTSLGFIVDEGGMVPVVQRFKEAVDAGLV